MGTGVEKGVAVPHVRLKGIDTPAVAFGRSKLGIDRDARDGLSTHFVFLILTPEHEEVLQVQILGAIAHVMMTAEVRTRLMNAQHEGEVFEILNQALTLDRPERAPQAA